MPESDELIKYLYDPNMTANFRPGTGPYHDKSVIANRSKTAEDITVLPVVYGKGVWHCRSWK